MARVHPRPRKVRGGPVEDRYQRIIGWDELVAREAPFVMRDQIPQRAAWMVACCVALDVDQHLPAAAAYLQAWQDSDHVEVTPAHARNFEALRAICDAALDPERVERIGDALALVEDSWVRERIWSLKGGGE